MELAQLGFYRLSSFESSFAQVAAAQTRPFQALLDLQWGIMKPSFQLKFAT
jgi:hypothetical protein